MDDSDAIVTANYELIPYELTVKNGSGSGSFTKGTVTEITPNFPASGKEFDHWEKTSGKIKLYGANSYYTTVKMKASDATVTAVYKEAEQVWTTPIRTRVITGTDRPDIRLAA